MNDQMKKALEVRKAYRELCHEARLQVDNVLADDVLSLDDVEMVYLATEVRWSIQKAQMDLGETHGAEVHATARRTVKSCERWLSKWQ